MLRTYQIALAGVLLVCAALAAGAIYLTTKPAKHDAKIGDPQDTRGEQGARASTTSDPRAASGAATTSATSTQSTGAEAQPSSATQNTEDNPFAAETNPMQEAETDPFSGYQNPFE